MFAKKEEGQVRPISAAFATGPHYAVGANIVGVPVAITLGGPGAVFWIWIWLSSDLQNKWMRRLNTSFALFFWSKSFNGLQSLSLR